MRIFTDERENLQLGSIYLGSSVTGFLKLIIFWLYGRTFHGMMVVLWDHRLIQMTFE